MSVDRLFVNDQVKGHDPGNQVGPPREVYEEPASIYVAARLGSPAINLLPAALVTTQGVPLATATIGARTEHIRITHGADGASLLGRVEWIEHLGDQNHLHITVGGHRIVTLVDPEMPLRVGDVVGLALINPLFFDSNGQRIVPVQAPAKVGDSAVRLAKACR